MDYRREIDGLRALAVLPVILFHAGFEVFSGGFVGVDVFFVISGYLITTILIAELEQGKFSIANFYERRARRILPALFFVMLVSLPFAWLWLKPSDMKDFSESLAAVSVFSSNILFWRESGYFDTAAELKPLLHTWSLAVEEQFYVLFPLFLLFFWGLGKRWILITLAFVFIASLAAAQWGAYAKPVAAFYLLPTRAWELLAGAFAAFYLAKVSRQEHGSVIREIGGWLGVILILYAVFAYTKATPFPGFYALVPALGAVLVILFANHQTTVGKFIGNSAFVGVGLISYSAYLWHQPLFAFLKHSDFQKNSLSYGLLIAVTLALAFLSWKYVEAPFRNKDKLSRKKIFILSFVFSIFFFTLGVVGNRTNGFEDRNHIAVFKDLSYNNLNLGYAQCNNYLTNEEPKLNYCMGATDAPTALIVGDSHADDKFYGIEKNIDGYEWMLVGNSSCPPLLEVSFKSPDGTECTEKLSKIFSFIDANPSIRVVVLSFAHMYPLDDFIAADHTQINLNPKNTIIVDMRNSGSTKLDSFDAGLQRTVAFLAERNIKTIISLDIPELDFFPSDCLKNDARCNFYREHVLLRQESHRKMANNLKSEFEGLLVFDPLPLFCPSGSNTCTILSQGRTLYRDSHHLTHYGSLVYGQYFSKWFAQNIN